MILSLEDQSAFLSPLSHLYWYTLSSFVTLINTANQNHPISRGKSGSYFICIKPICITLSVISPSPPKPHRLPHTLPVLSQAQVQSGQIFFLSPLPFLMPSPHAYAGAFLV